MTLNLKLRPDRVLVQEIEEGERTTTAGIIVPAAVNKSIAVLGTVVLTGSAIDDVKEGDTVAYTRYGEELRFNGENYRVLTEDEILGVIE